jgi:hypothetical protein
MGRCGSLQGKKPPDRQFFEILWTKRSKLLRTPVFMLPAGMPRAGGHYYPLEQPPARPLKNQL